MLCLILKGLKKPGQSWHLPFIVEVGKIIELTNPNFKRDRWMAGCGYEVDNR